MLNMFLQMGLIEKMMLEVEEKYMSMSVSHTFFNPQENCWRDSKEHVLT